MRGSNWNHNLYSYYYHYFIVFILTFYLHSLSLYSVLNHGCCIVNYHWCCHNHHHFSSHPFSLSLSLSPILVSPFPLHSNILSSSRFSFCLCLYSLLVLLLILPQVSFSYLHALSSSFPHCVSVRGLPLLSSLPLDSFFFECFCYCYFFCLPPNRLIPVLDLFSGCWWLESLESCSPSSLWSGPITDDGSANPALNLIFSLFLFLSLLFLVSPNPDTSIPSSLSFRIRLSSRLGGSRLVHLLCLPLQRLLRRILPRTTLSVTDIPILSPTNQPLHIRPLPLLPPLVWLPPRILTLWTLRQPPSLLLNPRKSLLRHPPRRRPWLRPRTA